jgi:DNA-binding transcriptional regulator of glucitol operon
MSKGAFALFAAGVINVTIAGFLKATWKLLYAGAHIDVAAFNNMFFPVQSIGFLLAGIGIIAMLTHKQGERGTKLNSAVPVVSITFPYLVLVMVAGLGLMDAGLCVFAKKMKKPSVIVIFILSFVCCLGMGYLSTKDFEQASMNWIAEGVNFCGQGLFLLGSWMLHKAGLGDLKLEKDA